MRRSRIKLLLPDAAPAINYRTVWGEGRGERNHRLALQR